MIIFPAIDIKDGKCVRLLKGDFNKITSYDKSPVDQAEVFFKSGFKDIHIVDLDGALLGESKNSDGEQSIILTKTNAQGQITWSKMYMNGVFEMPNTSGRRR